MPQLPAILARPNLHSVGHVYVVLFSNGRIKVGRSQDIRARLKSLTSGRLAEAPALADGWYSENHRDWLLNELRLLVFCHERFGNPVSGKETFEGDYSSVYTYARTLPIAKSAIEGASA